MIAGHFTLLVESQTVINSLANKALPELGTALPSLFYVFVPYIFNMSLANTKRDT